MMLNVNYNIYIYRVVLVIKHFYTYMTFITYANIIK